MALVKLLEFLRLLRNSAKKKVTALNSYFLFSLDSVIQFSPQNKVLSFFPTSDNQIKLQAWNVNGPESEWTCPWWNFNLTENWVWLHSENYCLEPAEVRQMTEIKEASHKHLEERITSLDQEFIKKFSS